MSQEMNQTNEKLQKVRKSCHMAGIVAKIMFVICVVSTVCCFAGGVSILAARNQVEQAIESANENGSNIRFGKQIGIFSVDMFHIDSGMLSGDNVESDIPAVQAALNQAPNSVAMGIEIIAIGFLVLALAVAVYQLVALFRVMEQEDSPFSEKVQKRMLVALIIITVVLALSLGVGAGILGGFVTWTIYTIMDYGRLLQIQSDETL